MKLILKLLYLPFGIVFGFLGSLAGRQLFEAIWSKIDAGDPPTPKTRDANIAKVAAAAALQASTSAAAGAVAYRAGANTFHHLIGAWPGEPPAPEQD